MSLNRGDQCRHIILRQSGAATEAGKADIGIKKNLKGKLERVVFGSPDPTHKEHFGSKQ